jgi:hypothetical protein
VNFHQYVVDFLWHELLIPQPYNGQYSTSKKDISVATRHVRVQLSTGDAGRIILKGTTSDGVSRDSIGS